jgi:hypothetical protein
MVEERHNLKDEVIFSRFQARNPQVTALQLFFSNGFLSLHKAAI